MEELVLTLQNAKQLFDVLLDDVPEGALFVPGAEHVAAGVRVLVRVSIRTQTFRLRGRVLWRRMRRGAGKLGKGAAVAFDSDQAEAVRRLFQLAREPSVSVMRASKRQSVSVRVSYNSRFSLARDLVRDLSLGGLRIHTDTPPATGTRVTIYLRPPRALLALKLVGEVVWSQPDGVDPGFGVRFLESSPRHNKRLQRLLNALRPK